MRQFLWCSGHHVGLTHQRSPVRNRAETSCCLADFQHLLEGCALFIQSQRSTPCRKSCCVSVGCFKLGGEAAGENGGAQHPSHVSGVSCCVNLFMCSRHSGSGKVPPQRRLDSELKDFQAGGCLPLTLDTTSRDGLIIYSLHRGFGTAQSVVTTVRNHQPAAAAAACCC